MTNALQPEKQGAAYSYGKYSYGKAATDMAVMATADMATAMGYAAYNTSAAYSYYANGEDETQAGVINNPATGAITSKSRSLQLTSNGKESEKAPNLRTRLRAQRQRFIQWLDT